MTPMGGPGAFQDERDAPSRLLVALSKIGMALRSRAWQDVGPQGLNPTQAQILVALSRHPTGLRLSAVAESLAVTPPTVSDSVSSLVAKGMVEKGRAPDDARAIAIILTEEGRRVAERLAEWPDLLLATVDVLDSGEQAVLLRALTKVIRELQVQGQIAPARMCVTCTHFRPHVHDDARAPHHCAFVDAAFGDVNLRLDCQDHAGAADEQLGRVWRTFASHGKASTP